jgi:chromosome segregation ATPase
MDTEIHMDASGQDGPKPDYSTPARVQAWFLHRSRERWKRKYKQLKTEARRLQNRVSDVSKSRQQWREETKQLNQRVRELEATNAALQQQMADLKKDGQSQASGVDR